MKILYAGSPEASKIVLEKLFERQAECDFEIVGALSNPPSARGRHKELIPTCVADFALKKNIPVFTPERLDSAARQAIKPLGCDLLVSFAYGRIFGPKFLEIFPAGGINIHPSLLPKYRGCSPVPAAILNGDDKTAVTVQTLSLKTDEGDILKQREISLDKTETTDSLLNDCAKIGADLVCDLLKEISQSGKKELPRGIPQTGEPSYAGIIKKEDARIDWNENAAKTEAKIRAYFSEPGAWCMEKSLSLKILKSTLFSNEDFFALSDECEQIFENAKNGAVLYFRKDKGIFVKAGGQILCVQTLQRQNKKAMNYKDFINGAGDFIGTVLE